MKTCRSILHCASDSMPCKYLSSLRLLVMQHTTLPKYNLETCVLPSSAPLPLEPKAQHSPHHASLTSWASHAPVTCFALLRHCLFAPKILQPPPTSPYVHTSFLLLSPVSILWLILKYEEYFYVYLTLTSCCVLSSWQSVLYILTSKCSITRSHCTNVVSRL